MAYGYGWIWFICILRWVCMNESECVRDSRIVEGRFDRIYQCWVFGYGGLD